MVSCYPPEVYTGMPPAEKKDYRKFAKQYYASAGELGNTWADNLVAQANYDGEFEPSQVYAMASRIQLSQIAWGIPVKSPQSIIEQVYPYGDLAQKIRMLNDLLPYGLAPSWEDMRQEFIEKFNTPPVAPQPEE